MKGITNIGDINLFQAINACVSVLAPINSTIVLNKDNITLYPIIWEKDGNSHFVQALFFVTPSLFNNSAWTITATDGINTVSKTIIINEAKKYDIELYYYVPYEYQAVEYLESSGTQWIETGIVPNQNIVAQIKFMNLTITGNCIFGYQATETSDWRFFNTNGQYYFDQYADRIYGAVCPPYTIQELELGDYYVKNLVNNSYIISGTKVDFTGTTTITLNKGSAMSNNRWYYAKIFSSGELVSDLVPCYRKADTVAGMWNRVTNTFITNSGTGTFIVGRDI